MDTIVRSFILDLRKLNVSNKKLEIKAKKSWELWLKKETQKISWKYLKSQILLGSKSAFEYFCSKFNLKRKDSDFLADCH